MYPGARPRPEERYFSYAGADFWTWIPSKWVREGTIVISRDDRFWELTKGDKEGWWAVEVRPEEVGKPELITRIKVARIALDAASPDTTPAERLAELREDLVRFCNARLPLGTEPSSLPREKWWAKKEVVGICLFLFVLALGAAIVRIREIPGAGTRRDGFTMLSVTLSALFFGTFVFTLATYVLARYPHQVRRLIVRYGPTGNMVGLFALAVMALVGAALVWFAIVFVGGASRLGKY
jgi:hypothetical protein